MAGISLGESGLKADDPYCSLTYGEQRGGEVSGSSASQWSKSGWLGVFARGLSLGSVPGNAASAAAGTASAATTANSAALLRPVRPLIPSGKYTPQRVHAPFRLTPYRRTAPPARLRSGAHGVWRP